MSEKIRKKHYNPKNRYSNRHLLIRKLNDMMPIPDAIMTDLVLGLSLRLTSLRAAPMPYDDENREKLRQLLADMVLTVGVVKKLTLLFVDSRPLLDAIDEATGALQRLANGYKDGKAVDPEDIEMLQGFVTLYHDMMKQTRFDEYKKAVDAAAASLKAKP